MDGCCGWEEKHTPGAEAPVLRAPEWAKPEGLAYLEEAKIKTTAGTGSTLEEKAKTSVGAEAKVQRREQDKMRGSLHCGGKGAISGRDDEVFI
jgi:hypothetical protein